MKFSLKYGVKILLIVFTLMFLLNCVHAATIITNVTETNINSSVQVNGTGFSANTNYSIILLLENKSSWWDGFDEQWLPNGTNTTILVTADANGNFSYIWNVPNDWRISGGKTLFKVGPQLASALMWSSQGMNWAAAQPTKNGITGDSDPNGFVFTSSNAAVAFQGGVEKFYKNNGSLSCSYNFSVIENGNDLTNNGSFVYAVTSAAANNLKVVYMNNCSLSTAMTTAGVASWSVNVAPNNQFIIITYAANTAPRKYNISVVTPTNIAAFAPTAINSIAYDSCISPDSSTVYIGYANGNVTALNAVTGATLWNSDPPEAELGNVGFAFPVNGLSCDNDRVYVARSQVNFPAGIVEQGFVEALWAANGTRSWVNNKTSTIYDGMDVNNIRCDSSYCYAVKTLIPAPYQGIIGSAIFQINKTTGNVTWWNWRSWLPAAYNGAYGSGGTHSAAQTLWVDNDSTNGYIYPVYTNGWVQKITKNDVNAQTYDAGIWIRGLTNFWNYIADVQKNIWLSNETPYFNFKHWNQQGAQLNTTDPNLVGTFFRYSMLNTFNSFTAYEYSATNILGNSLFIDPVIQTVVTQKNAVQFFWNTAPGVATCTAARYGYVNLNGWYYEDRNCQYTEVGANATGLNIGTTINGTFITGAVYSLIKTKFWENYSITKYYGNNNWAWASWYNNSMNQQLGFTTRFGSDQEDVYSDNFGRAVLFINSGAVYYYRPQFRADLNRKTDNYILFKPIGGTFNGTNYLWGNVDLETQKIANPISINLSNDETGSFTIGIYSYSDRINFTAQEPNLSARNDEPVEIIFNATGGIRSDCKDIVITNSTDAPIDLWQVDNSTVCVQNRNVSVWIMMNWTQNELKNLRLYYNGASSTPTPTGTTDLVVLNTSGGCASNNQEINVTSTNWYNWTRPAAAAPANEITKFMFNDTTTNMWVSAVHYQVANCYKNSNASSTGAGLAADSCGTANPPVSRCLVAGGTGKIFAKLNATVNMGNVTNRNISNTTLYVEYYFFANTGRVRVRTQLNQSLPMLNGTVSKNWPPYYYFSINTFIAPYANNSWVYYSGLYEQMKKPIAVFNPAQTEVNLSVGPLPLMFTIKYGGFDNITQSNGSILKPASLDQNFWNKGCTAHKIWEYYSYTGGTTYGTAAAPFYTSEFISCDDSLASQLPTLGQPGYVNVIPEMAWDGTTVNRWADQFLIGKFYMMPNSYRPYNRDNRLLAPYATATGVAGDATPYSNSSRISSYIIPVCPEEQYGYKGYDDFLADVPNLIANTSMHITTNTQNIPCAVQIIKFTDQRGSDGTHFIFAKNLTVIVGETMSAGWTYPFNTFAPGTYTYQANGNLDMTFAQKSSQNAGYYGKYYFTYTPYNYVIDAFSTSGAPQFTLTGTPSTPTTATAVMYTTRYAFAPEAYYTKNVFDESALWNTAVQNFTYYRNPCWLGRFDNIYGATEVGYPLYAALSTPGWQTDLWGSANNAYSTTCPHSNYNLEIQDVFRPAWDSKVPAAGDTGAWNELFIDGRENFAGNGTPPNAQNTYYTARHNALVDYAHSDDFNSILTDYSDLNQGEKHPNKQPWYCQISRHTNRSFCVMTNSMSTLIYNFAPGAGLTNTQGWSPYWSSVREATTFRNYFVSRYGDVAGWLMPYDNLLDVTMYPALEPSEVMTANLLYTTNNPDDYQTFFRNQFPVAEKSLQQTQFLLKDWTNSSFIYFDQDSRQYASGLPMGITGIALFNGSILTNVNITLEIYDSSDNFVTGINTTTNSSGMFNWTLTLPANLSAGLNYVQFNYTNGGSQIIDKVAFRTINLIATISSNKAAYEQGENATTTIAVANSYTGLAEDPDQLELRYINPSSQIFECAKYPSTAVVAGCDNNLTRTGTGIYTYNISLGNNSLGVYTERATLTQDGVAADFNSNFVIALIDPCRPNSLYSYALNYPMSYNNSTDTITIIGNSTFGNSSNPITFENIYAFGQATKGTCIIDKPSTGAYFVKSKLTVGNGTQEVYVSSKGESISFSSAAMPQLLVNKTAHMIFGTTIDGIPQEGSNIKFQTNQTDDILLDIAGGELAFYDCYVGDVGNYWGRFMYRGSCGALSEENSAVNSSIIIKKTTFDRASKGQFFFTGNVTVDDMKINRVNSSSSEGYGLVFGCTLPVLNNLQIYHQSQNGSAIFIANNTPTNTNLIVQNSFLSYNSKDIVANKDGRGVTLVNTQWDRTYGFNWTGSWSGTTSIKESYSYLPAFLDTSSQGVENVTVILLDRLGNIELVKTTNSSGEIGEQYVTTWEADKTSTSEVASLFNPYTAYAKKYGMTMMSEPKLFTAKKVEIKQMSANPFTVKSEAQAAALKNITYNSPTQVIYGEEYNSSWTTAGQLKNYPVDQCQYFAIFENETLLSKDVDYTIDYRTGAITFLHDVTGNTIYPVYFYGGNVTITNGFTITNALSMNDVYDYTQYQTSNNNLTEDIYTVDGLTYNFCVNLIIGNTTSKGSLSDSSAKLAFKDGYDLNFDGLGGFVDLAGITAGGGANGGLPLNIFDNMGSNYAPGSTAYLYSTVMNSQGVLVDATVSVSTYYPNGTLFSVGTSTRKSVGRFEYNLSLPADAPTGTWLSNIDAVYSGTEVHDNLVFTVSNTGGESGGENSSTPIIQIDAPSTIESNKSFGIVAFARNSNGILVNCDSSPLLTLSDLVNGSVILNEVTLSSTAIGRYNYTALMTYPSTFLAVVSCNIGGVSYISNPKVISTQNVAVNNSDNSNSSSTSTYPTIELSASTPIITSALASIGALVKSSTGIPVNCNGSMGITIINMANGSSTSGTMSNLGTGMYNYSWTTPATAGVFYINASCLVPGTLYTGFTLLSTQQVGTNISTNYDMIAAYVWNYTSRNLTYYNQSVADSIQSCLKDAQCSNWWINTTVAAIQNTINQINATSISIKNNTDTLLAYFNCTQTNDICTKLQNILNNATDIQARVNSLNTTQIPNLQTSINNVYSDTQFIRTNMATLSALQNMNTTLFLIAQNMMNQTVFDANITDLRNRISEINVTTKLIATDNNCSNPGNSVLCTYLNNINNTANNINNNMATYTQVAGINTNVSWLVQNIATQTSLDTNITDIRNRINEINTTASNILNSVNCSIVSSILCTYLNNMNGSINNIYTNMATYSEISGVNTNVSWLVQNIATQTMLNANITDLLNELSTINTTANSIKANTDCTIINSSNSVLCTYLGSINNTVNNVYTNMATYSQITAMNNNITWLTQNTVNQTAFDSNMTNLINKLSEINITTQSIKTNTNCTNPANSALCTYLNNTNSSVASINSNMATYSQITAMNNNITWLTQNTVNQTMLNNNITDLLNGLNEINSTTKQINTNTNCTNPANSVLCTYLNNTNTSVNLIYTNMATYSQITAMNNNITWLTQNTLTQTMFDTNMTELRSRLNEINSTTNQIKTNTNCTNPANSALCTYLNNMNITVNSIFTNMATYVQIQNISNDTEWLKNNVATEESLSSNFSSVFVRLTDMNSALETVLLSVLNNNGSNSSFPDLSQQLSDIQNNLTWIKNNVATSGEINSNFTETFNRLLGLNSSLTNISNYIYSNVTGLLTQINYTTYNTSSYLYNNITNTLTEINQTTHNTSTYLYTDIMGRLSELNTTTHNSTAYLYNNITNTLTEINQTTHNTTTYLYTNIANTLTEINQTTHNTTTYLYTNIANTLSELNITDQNMYNYLVTNISMQLNQTNSSVAANLTQILNNINSLQSDIVFVKNNMFYQGNATGSFSIDYAATVYTQPGKREDLWIATRDLLGNEKTVASASCSIMKNGAIVYNATTNISQGGVHAYWDISANQSDGTYYWNCTLIGSIMSLQVPFFVSNTLQPDFEIDSLTAGSPRYPNEEVLVEATFTNENGTAVTPDTINLTIYTPNGNPWATAVKQNLTKNNYNVWTYSKDIESNPTTGMYSIYMLATYNGMTSSKTLQFRIATGGPYKLFLDCPTTLTVGTALDCTVIIQDEGEVATESTTTVWLDTNNNNIQDSSEPIMSFSKKTQPLQIVIENISLNIPADHPTGVYLARAETLYINSAQPNSTASDSILFTSSVTPPPTPSSGGGGGVIVPITANNTTVPVQNATIISNQTIESGKTGGGRYSEIICNPPYIRNGINCCLDKDDNFICDSDERFPAQIINVSEPGNAHPQKTNLFSTIYSSRYSDIILLTLLFLIVLIILLVYVIPTHVKKMKMALAPVGTPVNQTAPITTPSIAPATAPATTSAVKEEIKLEINREIIDELKQEMREIEKEIKSETMQRTKEQSLPVAQTNAQPFVPTPTPVQTSIQVPSQESPAQFIPSVLPTPPAIPAKKEPEAEGNERFFLSEGGLPIKNISELANALENTSDETYFTHVSFNNNDFSNWIGHVLKQFDLANKVRETYERKDTVKVLRDYVTELLK